MYRDVFTSIPKKEVEENYSENNTSECFVRPMTPEERKKYFGEGEEFMGKVNTGEYIISNKDPNCKLSKDELIELCKVHGTSYKAADVISKLTGLSNTVIIKYIKRWVTGESKKEPEETHTAENIDKPKVDIANEDKQDDEIMPEKEAEEALAQAQEEQELIPRLQGAVYQVGNSIITTNYSKETISIKTPENITFKEAAAIVDLILELL